jgi:alpha-glucosidase
MGVDCNYLNVRYRVLMLEAYGNLDQIMRYYGTPNAPGGHFPFNFRLISDINNSSSAEDFSRVINEYLERITEGRTANWVVSHFVTNLYIT